MSSLRSPAFWDVRRLPRAAGKNFLVTGGNAGIGYFVAEQLAGTGATVILASRDTAKAEAAQVSIRARVPGAHVRTSGERLRGLLLLLLQSKEAAAWPAVRAVLDPSVRGGQLWGPRVFGIRGLPTLEPIQGHLADTVLAARLWTATASLTGLDPSANLK